MKLSKTKFEKLKTAIFNNGRTLDIELFKYKFENGEKDSVIEELAKYQNVDGGFGHGIEPDIRLKASSPIATTIGFQYCLKIGLSTEHKIYQKSLEYFLTNLNKNDVYWPNTFENVNDEPHAPWWQVEEIQEPPIERWANANAEIAGYLFKFQDKSKEITDIIEKKILKILNQTELIKGLYNFMCWERGLQYYPSKIKNKTKELIIRSYESLSPLTKKKMGEIRIFFLTKHPSDLINETLSEDVSKLIDNEIKLLNTYNACIPTWEWGMYPEAWAVAKREWIGKMTVDLLITLKNYNRLD